MSISVTKTAEEAAIARRTLLEEARAQSTSTLEQIGAHPYRWKMETAIRLKDHNPLTPDAEIARAVNLSLGEYLSLKRSKVYEQLEKQIKTGILLGADEQLSGVAEFQELQFERAIPSALQALVDLVLDKNNPKLRLDAAKEILDRSKNFGKNSKVSVMADGKLSNLLSAKDTEIASALIQTLKEAKDRLAPPDKVDFPSVDSEDQRKFNIALPLSKKLEKELDEEEKKHGQGYVQ